jgi:8-oxo-dGTP diphosphatase
VSDGAAPPAPTGSAGGAARMIPSTLVYVRQSGRTLMLRKARGHQKGKWNGLGGKAEPGEMPEACAVREVREEAGLEVEELDYRGLVVFPRFDGTNDWYVWIYLATARGEPRAGDEGELAWIDDERLPEL